MFSFVNSKHVANIARTNYCGYKAQCLQLKVKKVAYVIILVHTLVKPDIERTMARNLQD